MKSLEQVKELINDYRNSIKNSLNNDELSELDDFINTTSADLNNIFNLLENIKTNKEVLKDFKASLDNHMREEKWLEKLLKTS